MADVELKLPEITLPTIETIQRFAETPQEIRQLALEMMTECFPGMRVNNKITEAAKIENYIRTGKTP